MAFEVYVIVSREIRAWLLVPLARLNRPAVLGVLHTHTAERQLTTLGA